MNDQFPSRSGCQREKTAATVSLFAFAGVFIGAFGIALVALVGLTKLVVGW